MGNQRLKAAHSPGASYMARIRRVLNYGDRPWNWLTTGMAILTILVMFAIGLLLWRESSLARTTLGWNFLKPTLDASWNPVADKFQAWPFIYGTLLTSFVALVFAIPTSLGIAIFLAELSPSWLRSPLGLLVELLAAIPSVVYGLWGIFILLPTVVAPVGVFLEKLFQAVPILQVLFKGPMPTSGASRLAAALILSIMISPTIAAVSRDVFLAIPRSQRLGRGYPRVGACLGRDDGCNHGDRK
jgi:phosphate transport system permease protein